MLASQPSNGSYPPHRDSTRQRAVARVAHLTARDLDIVLWTCRHGIVTSEQVSRRFFNGRPRNAYRRIAALVALRLLRRDAWLYNERLLLRVTTLGARLVSDSVGPAKLVLAEVRHGLALVDLIEDLIAQYPEARLTTERELHGQRYRERQTGERVIGHGRMPDGLLTFPDGRKVGIELDISRKSAAVYGRLIRAYAAEHLDYVWWYVPSERVAEGLRSVVSKEYGDDRIKVVVWRRR